MAPEFPYSQILNLGGTGVILLAFVLLIWKGIPIGKSWLYSLLETFKSEIKAEREFGAQQLQYERTLRERSEKLVAEIINLNTQAIKQNTEATLKLEKSVEDLLENKS